MFFDFSQSFNFRFDSSLFKLFLYLARGETRCRLRFFQRRAHIQAVGTPEKKINAPDRISQWKDSGAFTLRIACEIRSLNFATHTRIMRATDIRTEQVSLMP